MAASRVNTKFVIILVGALVAVAVGGGGVAFLLVANNAKRLVSLGDKAMVEKDYVKAERLYSKAVNKEQSNPEFLTKWIESMEQLTPDSENSFKSKYQEYYFANMAMATRARQRDVDAHIKALGMIHREIKDRVGDTNGNSEMVNATDKSLSFFENASDKKHEVLRKFSGLALLRSMEASANLKDAEIERARTDLERAAAADPADGETATGLARWHDRNAFNLATKLDVDGAKAEREKARALIAEFNKAHPDDIYGQMWSLVAYVSDIDNSVREITDAKAREAAEITALADIRKRLDALAASMANTPAEQADPGMLVRLEALERRFSDTGPSRTTALYEKYLAARPADTRFLLFYGTILGEYRREKDAMTTLQKLVDIPQKPISYEGFMQYGYRARARYLQAIYSVRLWETEQDPVAKKGYLDAAKDYRGKLAAIADAESPELLFVDANLSVAAEDYGQALKKLMEYNRKTNNTDTQGLWMASECAMRVQQDGTAEKLLRELLSRSPNDFRANVKYAELLLRLRRETEALQFYDRAVSIDPTNNVLAEARRKVKAKVEGESGDINDPVSRALLDADKLENEGKATEALKLLETTFKQSGDCRVALPLAARLKKRDRGPEAIAMIKACIEKSPPDVQRFKIFLVTLETDDPMEQRIRIIENSADIPEVERLVAIAQVYAQFGKMDKADETLKKATALSPENPSLIELQFVRALSAKDFATAERLADLAGKKDLDLLGGITFKARMLDAKGQLADAVRELEAVRAKPEFSHNAGRMLAEMMSRQRRVADAIGVLREALAKRSQDRDALYALGILLVQIDENKQALAELKSRQAMHPADDQIQNLWLDLEAKYGDRDLAETQRKRRLEFSPHSVSDKLALAELYVNSRKFIPARELIDELKKTSDEARASVTPIEAQWYANRGDMPGAKKAFDDYVASVDPSKVTPQVLLAKGRFLEGMEQINDAAAAYKEAAKVQGKALEADKALADLLLRMGELVESRAMMEKIVDAGADTPDRLYAKRLIDVLLRVKDVKEAEKRLAAMGAAVDNESQLMLQKAEIVRLGGDEKKALEIIEQAAVKFPTDPFIYYRRAAMNARFDELRDDVLRDLGKAVEIRPAFWQARRDRARIYVQMGKFDDAIKDMRDAVKFNTNIDELRVQLIRDLLAQNRDVEAAEVIEVVMEKRPGDVAVLLNSGDLFREARRFDQAKAFYRRAFEISKQIQVVTKYLDLLHAIDPPDVQEVDRVLLAVKDAVDSEPALLMSRAKQYLIRKRTEDGIKDIVASARKLNPKQPAMIMAWGSDVKRFLAKQEDVTKIMDIVDQEKLIPGWTDFFKAGTLLEKEETRAEATQLLEQMVKSVQDEVLLRQSFILLHARYYQANDCDNGLRTLAESLQKFPEDAFILNNYSYTMLKCGKDPKTIVPFAERAVQAMRNAGRSSADIWDTAGIVYVKAGLLDKAGEPLQSALAEAGNSPTRATVLLHIAEYLIEKGDCASAEKRLAEAAEMIKNNPKYAEIAGHDKAIAELRDLFAKKCRK